MGLIIIKLRPSGFVLPASLLPVFSRKSTVYSIKLRHCMCWRLHIHIPNSIFISCRILTHLFAWISLQRLPPCPAMSSAWYCRFLGNFTANVYKIRFLQILENNRSYFSERQRRRGDMLWSLVWKFLFINVTAG